MKSLSVATLIIFIATLLLAFGYALPKVPDAKQVKKSPEAVKAGTAVYADKCRICHENTDIDMSKKTYTVMMPLLASMVDMEKLNRKQIDDVAAYVYFVSKK